MFNTTFTTKKKLILPHVTLTTHIEGLFSIIFVTYLFMCATEGQAFDDLFLIIFISSQEKFEPTNQINTHTSLQPEHKGKGSPKRYKLFCQQTCALITGNQRQPQTKAQSFSHWGSIKHQTRKPKSSAVTLMWILKWWRHGRQEGLKRREWK